MGPDVRPLYSSIPAIAQNQPTAPFEFPDSHHLVVTTEKRVLCLDKDGLSNVFTSSSSGILAAKEAKDGRGALAIADSQVVVLHNLEKGDKSYRLKGTDGQIRLLEYSPDGSNLFFTTTLLNAVQVYSLTEQRLLPPGPTHPSPPTVLAVSPSSHLLLSCSESPPIIYLQALILGTQPTRFQPWVSIAPVVRAAFHKSRPNVFVLAFKDGTIAAYDYNKLPRVQPILSAERMQGDVRQAGEIGHFKQHHAVTTGGLVDPEGYISTASLGGYEDGTKTVVAGARSISVTGIAFIPGFQARCVSVGADGKCKIVNFDRLNMLKEWHIKGPATCMSILSLKMLEEDGVGIISNRRTVSQISLKAPTPARRAGPDICHIAVGRVDGKVLIYDTMGNLLRDLTVDGSGGRVVDVDWSRGPKPEALDESRRVQLMDQTSWIELCDVKPQPLSGRQKQKKVGFRNGKRPNHQRSVSEMSIIPSESEKVSAKPTESAPVSPMLKATIDSVSEVPEVVEMPTEEIFDTIKHYTVKGPIEREVPAISAAGYMDLFSPVKPGDQAAPGMPVRQESPRRKMSARTRPRVTSSTYKSPVGTPQRDLGPAETSVPIENPASNESKMERLPSAKMLKNSRPAASLPKAGFQRISTFEMYKHTPGAYIASPDTIMSTSSRQSSSSNSSKILADIKRVAENTPFGPSSKAGNLAIFAPYMQTNHKKAEKEKRRRRSSASTVKSGRRRSSMLGEVRRVQTEIQDGGSLDEDIWLSTESSTESKGTSEETRRGRRSKQNHQSMRRHRSRGASGRPRRAYGEKGSSEQHSQPLPSAKILAIAHDQSRSSYHTHPPSSLYPASISTSLEPIKNPTSPKTYSPAQSLPSARSGYDLPSPSLTPGESTSRSPSLYASSATPSSSIVVSAPISFATSAMPFTAAEAPEPAISPSSGVSRDTGSSIAYTTSAEESEDTIVALPPPGHSRAGSALPLPPGYAESWAGPVEVENYLPRKGSLAGTPGSGGERSPTRMGRRTPSPRKGRGSGMRTQMQEEREVGPKRVARAMTEGSGEGSPRRTAKMPEAEMGGKGELERKGPKSPFDRVRERRALGDLSGNEQGSPSGKRKNGGEASRVDSVMREKRLGDCCAHCEELRNEVERLREEVRSLRRVVKGKGRATNCGGG